MTSRQRVEKALNHEYADRIPLGFDVTPEAVSNLMSFLKLNSSC